MNWLPEFCCQPVQAARAKIATGDTLDPTDLSNLWFIAGLCPDKAGKFVFDAQTLLQLLSDTTILFNTCDTAFSTTMANRLAGSSKIQNKNKNVTKGGLSLTIFPNPSNGLIQLLSPNDGLLTVTNIVGQLVMSIRVKQGYQSLDLSKLSSGIYLSKLFSGNYQISTKHIIINK